MQPKEQPKVLFITVDHKCNTALICQVNRHREDLTNHLDFQCEDRFSSMFQGYDL